MARPLITVVIPTRNRLALLKQAVASVRDQTLRSCELIVVDDASDDKTSSWLSGVADARVRSIRLPVRSERSVARNKGLAEASASLVLFLDDDDLLKPHALARLAGALERYPEAVAAIGGLEYFGYWNGIPPWPRRTRCRSLFWDAFYGVALGGPGVLYRREVLEQVGGFPRAVIAGEDWLSGIRVAGQGRYVVLSERLMLVRTRPTSSWSTEAFAAAVRRLPEEASAWVPEDLRWRIPQALRAAQHWRHGIRSLDDGRRLQGLRHLVLSLASDPDLVKAALLWRVAGPGMVKSVLPRTLRAAARAVRRGVRGALLNSRETSDRERDIGMRHRLA